MPAILSSRQRIALRLAWRFMAPYRWRMLGALVALLFTAAITLSLGQGIRLLVDQGFLTASPELLNRYILLFFVLVLGLAVGTFVRFYLVSWIGERFVADIRKRVFDHLIELHPGFYETNRSSEIQSRLTADTTLLQTVIGSSLSMALRNALMLVGGVLLMFVTNAKLTSIVVLALPLVIAPILLFGRRVRSLSRESQDRVADVGSYVGETLGQIKTVQAYNHQAQDRQRFAGTVERAFDTARKRIAQRAWLITVVIVLVLGAVGVMLWVGGRDVIAGSISAGELAAFVFYSLIVGMAFGTLSEVIGELQRAAGAAERIAELLRARSEIRPPAQPRKLAARVSGRIELQAVRFAYPTRPEHWAIDDISLAVEPGKPWPWSDLPAPASRPCSICSCVSSIRSRDGCCWTDSRSSNWTRPTCAAALPWCRRTPRCSSAASRKTSATAVRMPAPPRSRPQRVPRMPTSSSWVCRRATPPTWARAASACQAASASAWRSPGRCW